MRKDSADPRQNSWEDAQARKAMSDLVRIAGSKAVRSGAHVPHSGPEPRHLGNDLGSPRGAAEHRRRHHAVWPSKGDPDEDPESPVPRRDAEHRSTAVTGPDTRDDAVAVADGVFDLLTVLHRLGSARGQRAAARQRTAAHDRPPPACTPGRPPRPTGPPPAPSDAARSGSPSTQAAGHLPARDRRRSGRPWTGSGGRASSSLRRTRR
jgi:hypothetical protein